MSLLGELKLKVQSYIVPLFFSYDAKALHHVLTNMGIQQNDVVMVHASLRANSGFTGKPKEIINVLKELVGENGMLVMPSMTYTDSSKAYLSRGKPLKVARSPSHMGLLSEVFRRNRETIRSMSPTHPLLASGKKAAWFIDGHERQQSPFNSESPFARLLNLSGKIICIDTTFESITFTHFVEDHIKEDLPIALYEEDVMQGEVIDAQGKSFFVPVNVLSDEARKSRREERLIKEMKKQGLLKYRRIGNTKLLLVECKAFVDCVEKMVTRGEVFFDG